MYNTQFNPILSGNFFANPFAVVQPSKLDTGPVVGGDGASPDRNLEDRVARHLDQALGRRNSGRLDGHHENRGGLPKVLAHIREALRAAPDDAARSELLLQAREGIAQGIAQARQQLAEDGRLDERTARRIDAIEHHLNRSLDRLARHFGVGQESSTVEQPGAPAQVVTAGDRSGSSVGRVNFASAQVSQRHATVQIETREGDIVTLDFNRSSGSAQVISALSGEDGVHASAAAVRYVDSSLSYSVQGDINEEEQAAIDNLVKQASTVAQRFFGGQLDEAFDQAANLSLDATSLSSFSMNLEQTSVRVALGSYRSVAALQGPAGHDTAAQVSGSGLGDAASAVGELRHLLESTHASPVIAQPQSALQQLLEGIAQAKGFDGDEFAEIVQQLRELIKGLSSLLPSTEPAPAAEAENGTLNPAA